MKSSISCIATVYGSEQKYKQLKVFNLELFSTIHVHDNTVGSY